MAGGLSPLGGGEDEARTGQGAVAGIEVTTLGCGSEAEWRKWGSVGVKGLTDWRDSPVTCSPVGRHSEWHSASRD